MKIVVQKGKLSEMTADAYVLGFNPTHYSLDKERNEVEHAGSHGIKSFVDYRLVKQRNGTPLKQGEAICIDAGEGNSRKIVCIICRNQNKDYDLMKNSIREGLMDLFMCSEKHSLKHVAMAPLCVSDGLEINAFIDAFKSAVSNYKGKHCIEMVTIVTPKSEDQELHLKALKRAFNL